MVRLAAVRTSRSASRRARPASRGGPFRGFVPREPLALALARRSVVLLQRLLPVGTPTGDTPVGTPHPLCGPPPATTAGRDTPPHRYFVPPELLRASGLDRRTTLRRVQPHRLRALILEDLERYPLSSSTEIHARIGPEIPPRTLRRALGELVKDGRVEPTGERRWRRYSLSAANGEDRSGGR